MAKSRRQQVWQRAGGCCEYCRMPQDQDPRPFHLDHIRAQKHGGPTAIENLALSCAACSLFKGPNAVGYDPVTDEMQPLFNPRTQHWDDHFKWNDASLSGRTAIGRTTIRVLNINRPLRVLHRKLLIELGVFPPSSRATSPRCLANLRSTLRLPPRRSIRLTRLQFGTATGSRL
ncbi:MAG: HNH endonuclease signature motif containing protein [Pirellulaceae bacterium]